MKYIQSMHQSIAILVSFLLCACQVPEIVGTTEPQIRELTVLYTNDEHGWMEGMSSDADASHLYQLWREKEGYSEDGPFLLLSGGDNWTGPAISTWVKGKSMVDVMNTMGYDASAVGNHEFDFGLEVLRQRIAEANFPYLSANTIWKDSGLIPVELGILPFSIKTVNDLNVGIIGLTTTSTPYTTNPQFVSQLQFNHYEGALRSTVAEMPTADLDLLFVIAHVCIPQLEQLAIDVADLGIDLMGGGHCNELVAKRVAETVLLGGGYHFTSYAKAKYHYDIDNDQLVDIEFSVNTNKNVSRDSRIAAIIEGWQSQFAELLDQVVAYSETKIEARSKQFLQAAIDSWLVADPDADFAITNTGGFRASLPAGEITLKHLVSVMPFENNIVSVNLTGRTIIQALEVGVLPVVAGLRKQDESWIITSTDSAIVYDKSYRVLINDFMYAGGDKFQMIAEADPEGFDTGINYRQPFVDVLLNLQTDSANPLELQTLIRTR